MFLDLGGTIRSSSPSDTMARLKPLLPLFGITRVVAQEGLGDIKIPVSTSCRPNSRFLSTSQGKGITRELADISAIMESVETYHAERLPQPSLTASVLELRRLGRRFLEPSRLPCHPNREFKADNVPIGWLELEDLRSGEPVLAPRAFLSVDQTIPPPEATSALLTSTNGLASGNTLEEALLHGLYELIERDCLVDDRSVLSGERRDNLVNIDSLRANRHLDELLAHLEDADMYLVVRSIHGRLGIPAFKALVRPRGPTDLAYGLGFGAHYVPEVAVSRAITEAVQSRVTLIAGSRDDIFPWHYNAFDLSSSGSLTPGPSIAGRLSFADVPRPPRFDTFSDALQWTRGRLEEHDITATCYFNHQRPEYGDIPVVSVVSPGLRVDMSLANVKPRHTP